MNTVIDTQEWITATLLAHNNSNDCAMRAVEMVIIIIFLIVMMIGMQLMAVEMMTMIMKVMCDSAQKHQL